MIVVSARLAEENRTRCYQLGALAYVAKPYTPDQIFEVLAEAERWRERTCVSTPVAGSSGWAATRSRQRGSWRLLRSQLVAYSKLSLDDDRHAGGLITRDQLERRGLERQAGNGAGGAGVLSRSTTAR